MKIENIATDFKAGDVVRHKIFEGKFLVLATSSDDMVNCRYFDSNGLTQSQWFYPQELYLPEALVNNGAGFK